MAKKTVITNNGTKGGNLVGKPHNDKKGNDVGGIKAIVTDANNRPVELEGGEVIINKEASKKHWKELSRINQSAGNGVPIEKPIDPHDEDPQEFAKGGKIQFNPNQLPNKWILKYAQHIKKNYPEIWKKGGNIYGNQAFINLERVVERGYWLDSEEWMYIKWRSYVARHKGDFRIEGVVAMLKWVDKVDKGWQYMKNLIEDEIKKIKQKKSSMAKGGWSVSKNQRMSKGGSVENKSFVVFFKSNVLNNIVYTNIDSDSLENAIKTQKSAYDWSDIQWIKGFEQKDANYLQEFFLHNIKQKWETNSELSVHIKDDKILFKRNTDTVEFEFTPLFEIKENQRVFKEAYLSNENAEIYIDSDFNFDRNKIFELIFNKMYKGGKLEHIPSMSGKGGSIGFSVGDKGWYNGKKRVPIEITKLNEKNVYFLNTETGEVKRSETKNFERLFEKELNVQEREKFIEEANVEVESWQKNNEREEKLSKKPKKSNKEEAQTAISSKEKPDYYALFKQKFSVMEYTNNEVVGVQLTAFTEIAKENKLLKVQDITDLLTAIQKLA